MQSIATLLPNKTFLPNNKIKNIEELLIRKEISQFSRQKTNPSSYHCKIQYFHVLVTLSTSQNKILLHQYLCFSFLTLRKKEQINTITKRNHPYHYSTLHFARKKVKKRSFFQINKHFRKIHHLWFLSSRLICKHKNQIKSNCAQVQRKMKCKYKLQ